MKNIDKGLKAKATEELLSARGGCLTATVKFDEKIETTLGNLKKEKVKRIPLRTLIIAAAMMTLTTLVVIATPKVLGMNGGVINYFNGSRQFKYISDQEAYEKFNKEVGVSVSKEGVVLTVDNIAIDDNFINLFYTIESENPISEVKGEGGHKNLSPFVVAPFFEFKVNGKEIGPSNNNNRDAYYQSDHVMKGMERFNISQSKILEDFKLDIHAQEIFNIRDDWHISLTINKSEVATDSIIVIPNIKATVSSNYNVKYKHNIIIDKVVISPFGNQILISEKVKKNQIFSLFALKDNKGNFLDVYNTDLSQQGFGKSTNSFEFMKVGKDIEDITLIPIRYVTEKPKLISAYINQEEINLKESEVGAIKVESIKITNEMAEVQYSIQGIVPYGAHFSLLDKNGEGVELGDVYMNEMVNRQAGLYTQTFTFANATPEQVVKIAKIGIFTKDIELLYEEQIKIPLK